MSSWLSLWRSERMTPEVVSKAVAKAAGLSLYFTGKPCQRGHVAARRTSCGVCVECSKLHNAAYYARDPQAAQKRARVWEAANADRVKEQARARYAEAPDRARAAAVAYYAANAEACRARVAAWQRKNLQAVRASQAKWRARNADVVRLLTTHRRARLRRAEGHYTRQDVANIMRAQRGLCAYCRRSIRSGYHVDHIRPLSLNGSNWPKNLQLLCASCNSRKSNLDPAAFAQRRGLLC
jgi:5-methylcytosine-specific restriction endonuclease McrA